MTLHKENKVHIILFVFFSCFLFLFFFFQSRITYTLGNVFFGNVPILYNQTFAHFFFWQATNPLFGKPVPYAHHQLSRVYFIVGQLDQSIVEAKKELEIYPENVSTNYILGLTYGYNSEERLAIHHFAKYIESYPKSWAARNDKAWLEFRIGDLDAALTTISPVATSTDNPWVQNTYGVLLMNKGDYRGAQKAFINAFKVVENMSPKAWGIAYPGNDPRIYDVGLSAMKRSIEENLKYVSKQIKNNPSQ
jgi:tetratricopeptide (TPR) repeat protein